MKISFFLPKQYIFYDLLKQLIDSQRNIAFMFKNFAASFQDNESYSIQAKAIEHEADDKTREISDQLNGFSAETASAISLFLATHLRHTG